MQNIISEFISTIDEARVEKAGAFIHREAD